MIVVGGEALVDLVPATGGDALRPRLGGGPFTVAVALGRLGAPVAYLGCLSTDGFGEAQLGRLAASGVDTALVRRSAAPTALAVAALQADGSARYTFYTAGTAAPDLADPGPLPDAVTVVSLGSLALLVEPGASAYQAVLHREAGRGRLVALDPNVRPAFVADAEAYRARFRSWLPAVGLLKLSVEDAAWLAPSDPDPVPGWLAAGPHAVVLTDGAGGLAVRTRDGVSLSVPAVPVAV
ncbi:MAG TPA: PfkB family carbohydrate kinase, partial [Pseudonocardiaceae bacterium]